MADSEMVDSKMVPKPIHMKLSSKQRDRQKKQNKNFSMIQWDQAQSLVGKYLRQSDKLCPSDLDKIERNELIQWINRITSGRAMNVVKILDKVTDLDKLSGFIRLDLGGLVFGLDQRIWDDRLRERYPIPETEIEVLADEKLQQQRGKVLELVCHLRNFVTSFLHDLSQKISGDVVSLICEFVGDLPQLVNCCENNVSDAGMEIALENVCQSHLFQLRDDHRSLGDWMEHQFWITERGHQPFVRRYNPNFLYVSSKDAKALLHNSIRLQLREFTSFLVENQNEQALLKQNLTKWVDTYSFTPQQLEEIITKNGNRRGVVRPPPKHQWAPSGAKRLGLLHEMVQPVKRKYYDPSVDFDDMTLEEEFCVRAKSGDASSLMAMLHEDPGLIKRASYAGKNILYCACQARQFLVVQMLLKLMVRNEFLEWVEDPTEFQNISISTSNDNLRVLLKTFRKVLLKQRNKGQFDPERLISHIDKYNRRVLRSYELQKVLAIDNFEPDTNVKH